VPAVRTPVVVLVAALAAVPLGGCLVDHAARGDIADLRRQVDAYRRQAQAADKHAGQLDDRLLVVEDKVETAQVNADRSGDAPQLPVVKKAAPVSAAGAEGPGDGAAEVERYTDSTGNDVVVVYEGDAARSGPRAVIKLDESGLAEGDDGVAARVGPRRRRGIESDALPNDRLPVTQGKLPSPDQDPIDLYKRSYQAVTSRDHATAIAGFRRFLEKYPRHDYADNAQYWLGEAYYDQHDWQTALTEFRRVVKHYPDGNKAPDALLKIGYCYARMGDDKAARDVLSQVVEIYPKSEAAALAAKRLEELRQ
jgi:tol-pal system protein YbgF